jgi:hypothetical protein
VNPRSSAAIKINAAFDSIGALYSVSSTAISFHSGCAKIRADEDHSRRHSSVPLTTRRTGIAGRSQPLSSCRFGFSLLPESVHRRVHLFQTAVRRVLDNLWPGLIRFAKGHRICMANAAVLLVMVVHLHFAVRGSEAITVNLALSIGRTRKTTLRDLKGWLRTDKSTGGMDLLVRFPAGHVIAPHFHDSDETHLRREGPAHVALCAVAAHR